jgi:hypothetical protein
MCFYGDAGTGPCITNLSQDSLVKSACKTLQLFQNEVIVHFLFSFIIEISTSTRKDFSENHIALASKCVFMVMQGPVLLSPI